MSKLKEKVKAAQDITKKVEPIPEWDMTIELRTMKALDRARLFRNAVDKDGNIDMVKFQAGLIISSAFDPETGEKIFTDDDYELLMEKSAGVIERLSNIAMAISGLAKQTLVTAEKNS